MLINEKWDTEYYKYCEEHNLYYKKYCNICALYNSDIEYMNDNVKEKQCP